MIKYKQQYGFAHLLIIIILSVALLGTLGFVYYQNFIQKKVSDNTKIETVNIPKTDTNVTTDKTDDSSKYSSYSDEYFLFSYPKTGWSAKLVQETIDTNQLFRTTIATTDYEDIPASIDRMYGDTAQGAIITISKNQFPEWTDSLDEKIAKEESNKMIKDISKITVDGQPAYSFTFAYEGPIFLETSFKKNDNYYYVKYNYVNGQKDKYISTYELILNTLKVK